MISTDRDLAGLWNTQAQMQAFDKDQRWSDFRAFPTCPPSKGVWIVGGLCHWLKSEYHPDAWFDGLEPDGRAWTVPTRTYDFTDTNNLVSTQYIGRSDETEELYFANAGWYKPATLLLVLPRAMENPAADDWRAWLICADEGEEYETAAEAEAVDFQYTGGDNAYWPQMNLYTGAPDYDYLARDSGMPVAGVILRNDGVTGYGRNFLPIDLTNRGRSYLWPADMRPFNPDL